MKKNYVPTHYLNMNYYLDKHLGKLPDPPLHPVTEKPVTAADLASIFPMELIRQEMSMEERIEIPDEVSDMYMMFRPTPLLRAKRLERFLETPAHIYFKG